MTRQVLAYGGLMALLVFVMKLLQYRFFVRDLSFEFYVGLVAVAFTVMGVWIGWRIAARRKVVVTAASMHPDPQAAARLGISAREVEVLSLMAQGFSNREIAEKLFVSPNTVKTHTSSLFGKLEAGRRTQAVRRARELGIIG